MAVPISLKKTIKGRYTSSYVNITIRKITKWYLRILTYIYTFTHDEKSSTKNYHDR